MSSDREELRHATQRTADPGNRLRGGPDRLPIALRVADVAAARARLIAAGVAFHTEPFDSGVCNQAIFSDPAGNPLSLHHRYAERNPAGDQATLAGHAG